MNKIKYAWWRFQERYCKLFGHRWGKWCNENGSGEECKRCNLGYYN